MRLFLATSRGDHLDLVRTSVFKRLSGHILNAEGHFGGDGSCPRAKREGALTNHRVSADEIRQPGLAAELRT